jgi:hypothetical protein
MAGESHNHQREGGGPGHHMETWHPLQPPTPKIGETNMPSAGEGTKGQLLCYSKATHTNNEGKLKAQDHKHYRIPKEDQKLSLNIVILKSRSPLEVSVGLLL